MAKDNLDDFEDFFSSADDEPVAQPAQRPSVAPQQSTPTAPEPPVQKNDDDEDADDDVIVVKPHRWLKFIVIVAVVALLSVGAGFFYKYCSPYVVHAVCDNYLWLSLYVLIIFHSMLPFCYTFLFILLTAKLSLHIIGRRQEGREG